MSSKSIIFSKDKIEIDGVVKSLEDWSMSSGIATTTIVSRMKRGLNGTNLIAPTKQGVTIHGVHKTINEWASITGVSAPTIRYRMKIGMTGEELINPVGIQVEHNGKIKSLMEWSLELDVPYNTLYNRYRLGKRNSELFLPAGFQPPFSMSRNVPKRITISGFIKNNPTAKRLHNIWVGMKSRCYHPTNKDYNWYGAVGIGIDNEWKTNYFSFYEWATSNGYEKDLTLMRIDRKGHYEPSNCKWATMQEQQETRTNNTLVEINGEVKTILGWSKESGISWNVIKNRYDQGIKGTDLIIPPGTKIEFNGKIQTITEWSDETGISYDTLFNRLYRGKTGTELFKPVARKMAKNTPIEIDGVKHSLREWADIAGIQYATIHNRYKNGVRGKKLLSPIKKKVSKNN